VLGFSAALGLLVGSFLNVVIYRLPAGLSVVTPRSRCPKCERPIPWYENVPVLSFLFLRARCRGCGQAISFRYPLVELLVGTLFAFTAWWLVVRWPGGPTDPGRLVHLGVAFLFLGSLVALTFIDLDHRILPDRITKPGMAAGAILSVALPALQDPRGMAGLAPPGEALVWSVAGMVVGYGSLWLVGILGEKALGKEAMGLGDCKLLGMIGAFTGPLGAAMAAACGLVVGLLMGGLRLLATGDTSFPFGPSLAVGGAAVFLAREEVLEGFHWFAAGTTGPTGGLVVSGICGALLLFIRSRLPRAVFVVLLLMVALLLGLNLLLLNAR
jgi:leader peptidase (prepilin peptidase)/N-methyltransferase